MWFLAGLLLWGSNTPRRTPEAGRTLVVAVFLLVWIVAGILELIGVHL